MEQSPVQNWKLKENETATNHNRCLGAGGVWAEWSELSLIEAARKGNIEAVKKHITNVKQDFFNSIDVNAADVLDKTALHYAAAWGRIQIAELLIANGADVNTKSVTGRTPLDIANKNNKSKIADLLRKHGAKTGEELKAAGN